jgi:hypothetical protein
VFAMLGPGTLRDVDVNSPPLSLHAREILAPVVEYDECVRTVQMVPWSIGAL